MTAEDIAYIAGLFDGEGSVGMQPYRATKNGALYARVQFRIANTHRGVLEWVKQTVGFGHVSRDRLVEKYPRKPIYRYMVTNAKAVQLLITLRPRLIIKSETADRVLAGQISGRIAA